MVSCVLVFFFFFDSQRPVAGWSLDWGDFEVFFHGVYLQVV